MRLFNIEAIVLKSERYGEKDRFVHLLTREFGLLKVGAKGKKWGSRLEPATIIKGMVYQGKGYTLTEAELLQNFPSIRKNLTIWSYTSITLESICQAIFPGETDRSLFELLKKTLELLNAESPEKSLKITLLYIIKLISLSGYKPDLKSCMTCGAIRESGYLSLKKGGYLCLSCGTGRGLELLTGEEFNKLEELQSYRLLDFSNLREDETDLKLFQVVMDYYENVFEVELKSFAVLKQLFINNYL